MSRVMRLTLIELSPDNFHVTARGPDGAVIARVTGPASFCLEQLAAGLPDPSRRPWWARWFTPGEARRQP